MIDYTDSAHFVVNTCDASAESTQPKESEILKKQSLISCKYCGLEHQRSKKFCKVQTYCSFCNEAHSSLTCKKRLDDLSDKALYANTIRNLEVLTSNVLRKDQPSIAPKEFDFASLPTALNQSTSNPSNKLNEKLENTFNELFSSKLDKIISKLENPENITSTVAVTPSVPKILTTNASKV